ncbi:MAG: branched-chain-amino-acid transaminase [Spirochaetes bacterium]|nr:branched-chain-amino-acid transaminase [Spirochaetota bacterium]
MPFKAEKIWMNGKFVNWKDAKIHVLSHVIHYGSGVFEGIRCYHSSKASIIFRLRDHIGRLFDSAKIFRMEPDYSVDELAKAIIDTVKINKLKQAYIRPLIYRGFGFLGLNPFKCPIDVMIAAWDWGKYLGEGSMENGISVKISSWNRPAPNTFPSMAKICGNYANSQFIKIDALLDGYDEGIALDSYGFVSEGSGENVFIVRNGVIFTPPTSSSILPGITRHCIFVLARELGIIVKQHVLPRESLYVSDEVFLTGTAAEITPVIKIDNIVVSKGKAGPVTKKLQKEFFNIIEGKTEDRHGWLTRIK